MSSLDIRPNQAYISTYYAQDGSLLSKPANFFIRKDMLDSWADEMLMQGYVLEDNGEKTIGRHGNWFHYPHFYLTRMEVRA